MSKPSIGRIVHYRDGDDYSGTENWIVGLIIHVENETTVRLKTYDRFGAERYVERAQFGTDVFCWRWPPRI